MSAFHEHIESIPSVDSPLIFGLHPNADITYRLKEASEMLTTIIETQPKDSNTSVGKSVDEQVEAQAQDLLEKVPSELVEEVFRALIHRKDGLKGTNERGFRAPLNIFLFQELQRLANIISIVRSSLENLIMAIEGTVVMTVDLLEDSNCVFDLRVPKKWTHDASSAEISWLLPTIGGWCTGLTDRYNQLTWWLEHSRKDWKSFWITGFTNAQGFLTAIRQEVTRQNSKKNWALDDMVTHTEVLTLEFPDRAHVPEEGQNIHGLYIEGAKWNRQEGRLETTFTGPGQGRFQITKLTERRARMSDDDWLTDRTAAGSQSTSNADGGTQKVVAPPKLLLRPKPEETSTNSEKVEKPAPKTLKQKEAEYAAARARIFGYSANGGTGRGRGRASQGRGQSRAQQNNTSERKPRVDAHDPDYDRNPHRYAPRLVPGNESHGPSSRYIPPTYETEFPSL